MPLGPILTINSQAGWSRSERDTDQIFRTVDGGKSWKQVKIPQDLARQNFWVYVFDADMAFLQPFQATPLRYFYRTVDGGATWQRCNWPPMTLENVKDEVEISTLWTFLDHMHGWVMTPSSLPKDGRGPSPSENQMLFRTDDGGQTWQFVTHLPLKYGSDHLNFLDAHTGWLVTSVDKPGHTSPTDPQAFSDVLYVTHDGGHTWKLSSGLPLPAYVAPQSLGLTFFNQREGCLSVSLDDKNYTYMTQDGGNTWQVRTAPPDDVKGGVDLVDATHLNDLAFLYTLANGQWVKTSNPVPVPRDSILVVDFASSQAGLAVGTIDVNKTVMYKTDDGGKHWKKLGASPQVL